jgi:hypothetical protein
MESLMNCKRRGPVVPSFHLELGKTRHFRGFSPPRRGHGPGFSALPFNFQGTVDILTLSGGKRQRHAGGALREAAGARENGSVRSRLPIMVWVLAGKDHWDPIAEAAKLP